jgi:hypothetical protein
MALNERLTELALNIAQSKINNASKPSAKMYQARLSDELGVLLYTILSESQEKYFYRALEDLEDIQNAENGCGLADEAIDILQNMAELLCCSDIYREFRSDYTTEFFLLPFIAIQKPDSTLENTYEEGAGADVFLKIGHTLHDHGLVHPDSLINIPFGFSDHSGIPNTIQDQVRIADSVMGIGLRVNAECDIDAGDPEYADDDTTAYALRYLYFSVATPKKNKKQYKLARLNSINAETKEGEVEFDNALCSLEDWQTEVGSLLATLPAIESAIVHIPTHINDAYYSGIDIYNMFLTNATFIDAMRNESLIDDTGNYDASGVRVAAYLFGSNDNKEFRLGFSISTGFYGVQWSFLDMNTNDQIQLIKNQMAEFGIPLDNIVWDTTMRNSITQVETDLPYYYDYQHTLRLDGEELFEAVTESGTEKRVLH